VTCSSFWADIASGVTLLAMLAHGKIATLLVARRPERMASRVLLQCMSPFIGGKADMTWTFQFCPAAIDTVKFSDRFGQSNCIVNVDTKFT